jgi:hypothetical protein
MVYSPPSLASTRSRSKPPMRGITRSLMMMVGRNSVMRSSASWPSLADAAVKPQVRTSSVNPTRVAGSSSTMSTRSPAVVVISPR